MAVRYLSDLVGTLQTYFKVATVRLTDSSGDLHVKNAAGTAFAIAKASTLHVAGSNASNVVSLTAPAGLAGNVALTLPPDDGSSGQVLSTDGSGTLTWTSPVSNGVMEQVQAFSQTDDGSPVSIFTPPANSTIRSVSIKVASAAAGGSPTVSVGITGDADRDMDETECNLLVAGLYEVVPNTAVGGTPDEMFVTVTADSQTFSGSAYVTYSTPV